MIEQCGFDAGGVIVQRPVWLAWVGGFDEERSAVQRVAEGREESPITVQAGQVNQRGFAGGIVKAELEMFVARKT